MSAAPLASAQVASSPSFRIEAGQVETSGNAASSASHRVSGCVGAAVAGQSNSASHTLQIGCAISLVSSAKLAQAITFGPAPTLAVGATATVVATGGASGNSVVFSSLSPTICSTGGTNGSQVSGLAAGDCVVAANQAGNATYDPAPQATQTITVTRTAQQPLVLSVSSAFLVIGGTPSSATLSTTGGSGTGAVTFEATGPCTVSGTTLSGTALGTCSVLARKAADGTFDAVASNAVSVSVYTKSVSGDVGGTTTGTIEGGTCAGLSLAVVEAAVAPPKPMPYGALRFTAQGCGNGGTVRITLRHPAALGPNAVLLKRGASGWFEVNNTSLPGSNVVIDGSTVSFTITDGGPGDLDGAANGRIEDPIGVGFNTPAEAVPVPVSAPWALLLLALSAIGIAARRLRRATPL